MRPRAASLLALVLPAGVALAGCQQPPHRLAPLVSVGFDGGVPEDASLPSLDGNMLPLDGGAALGSLWLTVNDRNTGRPIPARVIFRPSPGAGFADSITSGKPDYNSKGSGGGAVVGPGVLGAPEGVLLVTGQGLVPVPPGTYTLVFNHGPEWESVETQVTVAAGESRPVTAQLDHTVDTGGWLAADMHVHTRRSFDSGIPLDRRVISMVTSGVEVVVPTDHNTNSNLAPMMRDLGYGGDVVGQVIGDEFNFKEGHGGAYPVVYDDTRPFGGAPPYQNLNPAKNDCDMPYMGINCFTATQAFPMMRNQVPGLTVVTVNHPYWPTADLGYFTNIGWGAGTAHPPPAALPTAGMFDALEVLNGYWIRADAENNLVTDWFALLSQGYRVTALGNSDTHKINWVRAGYPRTWLRLPINNPGDITGQMLSDALKNQRAVASTGPFVTFTADKGQIGDTVVPAVAGQVALDITADAPDWISLDSVRVYVNGQLKHTIGDAVAGRRPRFHITLSEPITQDSWIVVQASGSAPLPPDVIGESSHANGWEAYPWAITNPIYVDFDGDGTITPNATARRVPLPPPARLRKLRVPQDCEQGDGTGEPPLEAPSAAAFAPEHELMPLLFP